MYKFKSSHIWEGLNLSLGICSQSPVSPLCIAVFKTSSLYGLVFMMGEENIKIKEKRKIWIFKSIPSHFSCTGGVWDTLGGNCSTVEVG